MKFSREEIVRAIMDPMYAPGRPDRPIGYPVAVHASPAAVAARAGYAMIQPPLNGVLEINQIGFAETTAATGYQVDIISSKQLAQMLTLGTMTHTGQGNMWYMQGVAGQKARSTVALGNSVVGGISASMFWAHPAAAANTGPPPLKLERPVILFGDGPQTSGILAIANVGNLLLDISFIGREWPYDTEDF